MTWSETTIARALALQTFQRKHLVLVPNCNWTGHECDLLVVTPDLRIIDIEVKVTRADLKADARKDKWFHSWDFRIDGPWTRDKGPGDRRPREWPRKVWKHYYALPRDLWNEALFEFLPSPQSGVLLLYEHGNDKTLMVKVERPAKPCRDAQKINPADAVDIARLASLRMWDSFKARDSALREAESARMAARRSAEC